jgi:vacuolar protein sorting-associated protein 8
LSYDHTYVASGHASGHIQLFDVNNPKTPARFVPPTSMAEVASGRQEGHLYGSRIVSIGFVAGRHTAVVSADDNGLAFYHSLGKVLFVEATDTLRILGKYPDETDTPTEAGPSMQHPFRRRRMRKAHSILAMMPLPLGTSPHPTDDYHLAALLTPVKLVVVGLKPSPKTWYRRHREIDENTPKSRFKGVLAWYPSVSPSGAAQDESNGKARSTAPAGSHPMLVYGWGNVLNLVRISETKMAQEVRNPKNGKLSRVEIGRVIFEENKSWTVGGDVLALQWLNSNVGSSRSFCSYPFV